MLDALPNRCSPNKATKKVFLYFSHLYAHCSLCAFYTQTKQLEEARAFADHLKPKCFADGTLKRYNSDYVLWKHFNDFGDVDMLIITHTKAKIFMSWIHVIHPEKSGPVISAHLTGVCSILATMDVCYVRSRTVSLFAKALRIALPPAFRYKKPWSIFHCIAASKLCIETYTDLTCFAGVLLGYGGLMRCSEFAKNYSNWRPLLLGQLTMHKHEAFVTLNKSKTNQYGRREIVTIPCHCLARTGTMFAGVGVQKSFCPFCVLKRYLKYRTRRYGSDPKSVLLIKGNGVPLIMSNVQKFMRKVITAANIAYNLDMDPLPYTTHALRVGGTTDLARAGYPAHLIENMGRWLSAIWRRTYIASDYRDMALLSGLTATFLKKQCLFI